MKSLSRVQLFATPWTAAYQAPPSMGFSRQEYWSGVPLPSPKEISSLSHSIVFLYFFALIIEEGFLISSCYSLELCLQMLISFLFFFLALIAKEIFLISPYYSLEFCIQMGISLLFSFSFCFSSFLSYL